MEGKAKILVFGFSAQEERRVDEGLAALGVPATVKLRPSQGGATLRSILAGAAQGTRRQGAEELSAGQPLVLFHHISDAGVQELMRFIRGASERRPIFAVVTSTSIDWTLADLLAHLLEERAALERGA
jgi:hypothetical protein